VPGHVREGRRRAARFCCGGNLHEFIRIAIGCVKTKTAASMRHAHQLVMDRSIHQFAFYCSLHLKETFSLQERVYDRRTSQILSVEWRPVLLQQDRGLARGMEILARRTLLWLLSTVYAAWGLGYCILHARATAPIGASTVTLGGRFPPLLNPRSSWWRLRSQSRPGLPEPAPVRGLCTANGAVAIL